jgi:mersacidin/lichenicidin family type 2 lantibiotic
MSKANIIRAWKDEAFRLSLNAEQRALVPANPAGAIELEDAQLDQVSGGFTGEDLCFVTHNPGCLTK